MRATILATAMCLSAVSMAAAPDAHAAIRKSTSIPAQGLGPALQSLAKEHDFQLVYRPQFVRNRQTGGAVGELTANEALTQLLSGTGLTFRYLDERTVTIESTPATTGGTPPRGDERRVELEEVIVTGSHIRGADLNASPMLTFDRVQIERLGVTTAGQLLKAIPQNQGGQRTGMFATYGASRFPNLRGLGEGTTLVLIDGQRPGASSASLASGTARPNQFNLDIIPVAAIERVEILLDGASAIYGADAVGGVINVILRHDFEGAELSGKYLTVDSGDYSEYNYSGVVGGHIGEASVLLGAEYYDRGLMRAGERPYTALDKRPFGGTNQAFAGATAPINANVFATPGSGNLPGTSSTVAAAPGGSPRALTVADFGAGQRNPEVEYISLGSLVTPQERLSAFGNLDVPIGEAWVASANAAYSDGTNESISYSRFNNLTFGATNPYNPFGVNTLVSFYLLDLPTATTNDTEDYGATAGLKGQIGGWEVHANAHASESKFHQVTVAIDRARVNAALLGNSTATALNPLFGGRGTAPTVASALRSTAIEARTKLGTQAFSLGASGTIFQAPAGEVTVAFGGETSTDDFDYAGFSSFNGYANVDVDRDANAAYVEFGIPLASTVDLSLAARYEDYSDFGDTTNPKVGLRWRPAPGLIVRGTWGTAYQAPSLAQLNTAPILTPGFFFGPIFDPVRNESYELSGFVIDKGNTELQPQTADTLSIGLGYEHALGAGTWKASLDAYRVDFEDRIFVTPDIQQVIGLSTLFPSYVNRDPATGLIVDVVSFPVNLSTVNTSGVDFSLAYSLPALGGTVDVALGGTTVTKYKVQLTPVTPVLDRRSFVGFSNRLKGTLQLQYSRPSWYAAATAYFADSYRSDVQPNNPIRSHTTLDLQASYRWDLQMQSLSELKVTVGAINVFDREPPFYNGAFALGFDTGEGDPLQRRFYVQLSSTF